MNCAEIRKLDEDTLAKLKVGTGPADECLCNKRIKRKVKEGKGGKENKGRKTRIVRQGQKIDIPLVYTQGGGNLKATKEAVKRKGSRGKNGCDKENLVLKRSFANVRNTSPDISTFCSCPTHNCLLVKNQEKLKNNTQVTIERIAVDPDSENSETSIHKEKIILEPPLFKKSVSSLINAQYETEEDQLL